MANKLTRDTSNKKLTGVCSGLAKYFDMDPTIMRIIFVCCVVFGGFGLLLYLILTLMMPADTTAAERQQNDSLNKDNR